MNKRDTTPLREWKSREIIRRFGKNRVFWLIETFLRSLLIMFRVTLR